MKRLPFYTFDHGFCKSTFELKSNQEYKTIYGETIGYSAYSLSWFSIQFHVSLSDEYYYAQLLGRPTDKVGRN